MPNKPILIFPKVVSTDYIPGEPSARPGPNVSPAEQGAKLQDKWKEVEDRWEEQIHLSQSMTGSISEMVLVLEVKGNIDSFYSAVKETAELQFLGEDFDFAPDGTATVDVDDDSDPYYPTDSRIYLTLQNEDSLRQILNLWNRYLNGGKLDRGLSRYITLFQLLQDVRVYSVQDRLRDTGMERYVTDLQRMGETSSRVEVELLFRTKKFKPASVTNKTTGKISHPKGSEEIDDDRNNLVYESFKSIVEQAGGNIIEGSRVVIPEIQYHAVAANIPLDLFEDLRSCLS